ncbi:homocysteine S-methyltransferase [Blastococcus sp. MG754426]|uniref:homocysteine S-methyltransferase n=1 Tax=unclassified Blastococcus TaxID=2619396 RepID=UPI001EF138C8|nr:MULTISPECIES: homocysteine S-methyltransferase [unclassified Blastococcus]MCF6508277.1 homocysteine S-methyltransferase [Blastococcus sp. MG754426]MCF6512948.1 homocysteine S-methyltransferase [Blastococcus sp. MG754427]MCF6734288.1 homocysteine S-methyltransferase [Blastococcus sp. KM273129]
MPDLTDALAAGPVLLDGGLSTELEARGHDVSSALWSARLLRDDPAAVVAAHAAFAAAGARVATTVSYQATVEGFAAAGVGAAEAHRLIASSVALAREGQGEGWVAGSVGPYGAMLADGSEYTGDYADRVGVAALRAFHRPRMELLAEAGADVLACETVPAAAEAEALVLEAQALGVPVWLSLTTVVDDGGVVRTRRGEPAAEVFAMAGDVDAVVAVGVNCTAPSGVGPAVTQAARTGKPVVVYPNSGEAWDAVARGWTGTPGIAPDDVPRWVADGARLIGGCCRVRPQHLARLARTLP